MTIEDKIALASAEEHLRKLRSGELYTDVATDWDGDIASTPDTTRAEDAIEHLVGLVRRLLPAGVPA